MYRACLLCLLFFCCMCDGPAAGQHAAKDRIKPSVSLTLIPPSPVTDKIELDIRASVRNRGNQNDAFTVSLYLDDVAPEKLVYCEEVTLTPGEAKAVRHRRSTKGLLGEHQVICEVKSGENVNHARQPIKVFQTGARSTGRLGGAWVDFLHHREDEGKPFDAELAKMTDKQWRELVKAMHAVDQVIIVITFMVRNYTHVGEHNIEKEGYHGKAYYPSELFPARAPIASKDPLEAILSEADRLGMHVMPGVGCYALLDYTPASLRWHKKTADELWKMYGRHPSFYGWYVSEEIGGNLGTDDRRRQEIVNFFREFTPHVRAMSPDKPIMLATNTRGIAQAGKYYRKLLPHLDILCPFGFHRMPAGDMTGEEAAAKLQSLCDANGCHLWMDLESFARPDGPALYPRPIEGLLDDLRRFPNFEKVLHYQFPGMMSSPSMSRRPGGAASVELYEAYNRYLQAPGG
ncbi:MAG: DUF4434 domain-containing protein [Pirellulales bacterium]|nr:DUF4434 domain-containing protein [Pirellulales bacterium]